MPNSNSHPIAQALQRIPKMNANALTVIEFSEYSAKIKNVPAPKGIEKLKSQYGTGILSMKTKKAAAIKANAKIVLTNIIVKKDFLLTIISIPFKAKKIEKGAMNKKGANQLFEVRKNRSIFSPMFCAAKLLLK